MTTAAMLTVVAICLIGLGLLLVCVHLTKENNRLKQENQKLKDSRIIENANDFVNDFLHTTH